MLAAMSRLFVRIDLATGARIGPGKIALLEAIAQTGSISAAGRRLGMSYRRAAAGRRAEPAFRCLLPTQLGGSHGGGASLTALGSDLVARFRALEQAAEPLVREHLGTIEAMAKRSAGE